MGVSVGGNANFSIRVGGNVNFSIFRYQHVGICYNNVTTTTRLAVSVWGSMFVFYFILILSILIVSIKYNVESNAGIIEYLL